MMIKRTPLTFNLQFAAQQDQRNVRKTWSNYYHNAMKNIVTRNLKRLVLRSGTSRHEFQTKQVEFQVRWVPHRFDSVLTFDS